MKPLREARGEGNARSPLAERAADPTWRCPPGSNRPALGPVALLRCAQHRGGDPQRSARGPRRPTPRSLRVLCSRGVRTIPPREMSSGVVRRLPRPTDCLDILACVLRDVERSGPGGAPIGSRPARGGACLWRRSRGRRRIGCGTFRAKPKRDARDELDSRRDVDGDHLRVRRFEQRPGAASGAMQRGMPVLPRRQLPGGLLRVSDRGRQRAILLERHRFVRGRWGLVVSRDANGQLWGRTAHFRQHAVCAARRERRAPAGSRHPAAFPTTVRLEATARRIRTVAPAATELRLAVG